MTTHTPGTGGSGIVWWKVAIRVFFILLAVAFVIASISMFWTMYIGKLSATGGLANAEPSPTPITIVETKEVFVTKEVVITATPSPTEMPPTATLEPEKIDFSDLPFTMEGEDGTAKFGFQRIYIVIVTNDNVRHSCQIPNDDDSITAFLERYRFDDISDVLDPQDSFYVDFRLGISSEALAEYDTCFSALKSEEIINAYRAVEVFEPSVQKIQELEKLNLGYGVWYAVRFSDGRESSVRWNNLSSIEEGYSIVRVNWHIDIPPEYQYPEKSEYQAD